MALFLVQGLFPNGQSDRIKPGQFIHLKQGESFSVYQAKGKTKGSYLGKGSVKQLTDNTLELRFTLESPYPAVQLRLNFGPEGKEHSSRKINYSIESISDGDREMRKGIAEFPDYLGEAGILAISTGKSGEFFQMSQIESSGQKMTILISESWRIILVSP